MKRFELTFFYGPRPARYDDPATFRGIAESGMTLAQLGGSPEECKKALVHCAAVGLRVNVCDGRVHAAMAADEAECDRIVREICEDYRGYEALNGFDLIDEPHASRFNAIGRVVAAFRRHAPQWETVINLFPNYANAEQLGNATYDEHLAEFVARVRPDFISYDHYHFLGRDCPKPDFSPTGDRRSDLILENAYLENDRPGFFENAEAVRRHARENGLDAMAIVLLTEHGPYRNLTRAELSWEASMCLAYGFRRVSYFTYEVPRGADDDAWRWDNAMVDTAGNTYRHYYDVQAIAKWLLPLGQHLFTLDCERVVHTANEPLQHGGIRAVAGDAVCGCYSDGSVLLVNKSHLRSADFTVEADTLSCYDPAEDRFVPCDNTITLGAGECVLVK